MENGPQQVNKMRITKGYTFSEASAEAGVGVNGFFFSLVKCDWGQSDWSVTKFLQELGNI